MGEKGRERTGHKSLFTNNGVTAKLGKQCQTITKLAVLGSSLLYTKSGLVQAITKKILPTCFHEVDDLVKRGSPMRLYMCSLLAFKINQHSISHWEGMAPVIVQGAYIPARRQINK